MAGSLWTTSVESRYNYFQKLVGNFVVVRTITDQTFKANLVGVDTNLTLFLNHAELYTQDQFECIGNLLVTPECYISVEIYHTPDPPELQAGYMRCNTCFAWVPVPKP